MIVGTGIKAIDPYELQKILSGHLAMYRGKVPFYQASMLDSLAELWDTRHRTVLDIGSGTGVVAQAMAELLPVDTVQAIDIVDRFCPTLSVPTAQFDGRALPFADRSFEAATLNNVVHHVPVDARVGLFREIRRVVSGPLYIKDHEYRNRLDYGRLMAMDAIGNIPFGGMIRARYLTRGDWESLAKESGYRIVGRAEPRRYRSGAYAVVFPNRLETTMRLEGV